MAGIDKIDADILDLLVSVRRRPPVGFVLDRRGFALRDGRA